MQLCKGMKADLHMIMLLLLKACIVVRSVWLPDKGRGICSQASDSSKGKLLTRDLQIIAYMGVSDEL